MAEVMERESAVAVQGMFQAEVSLISGDDYVLRYQGDTLKAKRAYDCVLHPAAGDQVCAVALAEEVFILSILVRNPAQVDHYHFPNHTVFEVAGMCQHRAQVMDIEGEELLNVHGQKVNLSAHSMQQTFTQLQATGEYAEANVETIRTRAETIDVIAQCLQQQLQRAYRWIERFEQYAAGRLRMILHDKFRVDSKETHFCSEGETKVDASKIHLG